MKLAAFLEAATGVALLAWPSLVTLALLDSAVAGAGMAASRIAGAALLGLAVACWPSAGKEPTRSAIRGMLIYTVLAAVILACLGIVARPAGPLLWPAVVAHLAITASFLVAGKTTGSSARTTP